MKLQFAVSRDHSYFIKDFQIMLVVKISCTRSNIVTTKQKIIHVFSKIRKNVHIEIYIFFSILDSMAESTAPYVDLRHPKNHIRQAIQRGGAL